jgi:VRR-NUC domain.
MKIKMNPDGTFPELTKGDIREAALKYFRAAGYKVWRNNNTSPTRRRTFIGEYGVSDIIGYSLPIHSKSTVFMNRQPQYGGEFIAVEVKTKGDRLSEAQKKFLADLNKSGGFGYVAEDDGKGGIKYYLYLNEKS